jgi:hypothetical protein
MPSSFINHIVASSKVQKRPLASSNSRARVAANTAKFKAREGVHLKFSYHGAVTIKNCADGRFLAVTDCVDRIRVTSQNFPAGSRFTAN